MDDGMVLPPSTIVLEQNYVIYIDPKTGKYSRLLSWLHIRTITL